MTLENKGLTATIVFQANSANYGESLGNVSALKKVTRGDGNQYSYISRQALRYNMVNELNEPLADLEAKGSGESTVIQFANTANIKNSPEIDLFGYMKTDSGKNATTRNAVVRLSNAMGQTPYQGDTDFLTNMGLAKRMSKKLGKEVYNNIAQSEIQADYYVYTVTIDLDKVGIDKNDKDSTMQINNQERARRVNKLLTTIQYLYRDIRGRREDLKPLFIIGGIYDIKNPFFENEVHVNKGNLSVESIQSILEDKYIAENTSVGLVNNIFKNDEQIKKEMNPVSVTKFMQELQDSVSEYYTN